VKRRNKQNRPYGTLLETLVDFVLLYTKEIDKRKYVTATRDRGLQCSHGLFPGLYCFLCRAVYNIRMMLHVTMICAFHFDHYRPVQSSLSPIRESQSFDAGSSQVVNYCALVVRAKPYWKYLEFPSLHLHLPSSLHLPSASTPPTSCDARRGHWHCSH